MQWLQRISHLNGFLNARVNVNCELRDALMENWMPISHLVKAGLAKIN